MSSPRPCVAAEAPFSAVCLPPRTQAQRVTPWRVFLRCGLANWPQQAVPHAGELRLELGGRTSRLLSCADILHIRETMASRVASSRSHALTTAAEPGLAWRLKAKLQHAEPPNMLATCHRRLFKFLTIKKLQIRFLGPTSHTSSTQQPRVARGKHTG